MKLMKKILFGSLMSVSFSSMAVIYYIDGQGQNIGDLSLGAGGKPVSSVRGAFSEFQRFVPEAEPGKAQGPIVTSGVMIANAITGMVSLPGIDVTLVGNVNAKGTVTCAHTIIGARGQLQK